MPNFPQLKADKTLDNSAIGWFTIATIGQLIFAFYVASFYGKSAAVGNLEKWNEILTGGFRQGETMGNVAVGIHLLFAVIIMLGGPLQFIPKVRKFFPKIHRWNGRLYLLSAYLLSIGGIYMIWTRGAVGDLSQHIATTTNGLFIMMSATFALKYAMAQKFDIHRKWAIRLFLCVSGVWFFRIGLMLSFLIFQRPFGFEVATFTGPFLTFLAFAQFLLPLSVAEIYFQSQESQSNTLKYSTAILLTLLTIATALGIFSATMGMWIPRL